MEGSIDKQHLQREGLDRFFMMEIREFLYLNLYHKERVELKWA